MIEYIKIDPETINSIRGSDNIEAVKRSIRFMTIYLMDLQNKLNEVITTLNQKPTELPKKRKYVRRKRI